MINPIAVTWNRFYCTFLFPLRALVFLFAFNVFRCQIKHVSLFLMQPFTCKRNQGIEREALSPGFVISQHSNLIYLYEFYIYAIFMDSFPEYKSFLWVVHMRKLAWKLVCWWKKWGKYRKCNVHYRATALQDFCTMTGNASQHLHLIIIWGAKKLCPRFNTFFLVPLFKYSIWKHAYHDHGYHSYCLSHSLTLSIPHFLSFLYFLTNLLYM